MGFGNSSYGQSNKPSHIGVNIFPIIGRTLEIGYTKDIKQIFQQIFIMVIPLIVFSVVLIKTGMAICLIINLFFFNNSIKYANI